MGVKSLQFRINLIISTNMVYHFDKEFVKRLMIGKCTNTEKVFFNKWIDQTENLGEILWMKKIWEDIAEEDVLFLGLEDRILNNLMSKISCLDKEGKLE